MNRYFLRCLLVLLASLLSACSSFDKQWHNAAHGQGGATRWDGHWTSGKNVYANGAFHHGRLRCVLVTLPDRSLVAHFHANWLIFSGNYDTALQPVPAGPRRRKVREYQGTHDLPALVGGTYHYHATIEGDRFLTHYTSSYDTGTFDLRQVPPAKERTDLHAQH
ncbi:MAG: hypothetical protein ABJF10_15980 [Chthoniobacter sp.]|uniref:hypothetical protein n=1 Tax=Chthoniobacter sp. TaxID=2510640 RepID=UPI0032A73B33